MQQPSLFRTNFGVAGIGEALMQYFLLLAITGKLAVPLERSIKVFVSAIRISQPSRTIFRCLQIPSSEHA